MAKYVASKKNRKRRVIVDLDEKSEVILEITTAHGIQQKKFTQYRDNQGFFVVEYDNDDEGTDIITAATNFENSLEDVRRFSKIFQEKMAMTSAKQPVAVKVFTGEKGNMGFTHRDAFIKSKMKNH